MFDLKSGSLPCASFARMTHVASLLGLLFILFMFFQATTIRWWLMLPLGGASAVLFWKQLSQTEGTEQKFCRWALWVMAAALIVRDMCVSGQLVVALHG